MILRKPKIWSISDCSHEILVLHCSTEHARLCDRVLCSLPYSFIAVNIKDPDTKVQEFMDSKPLLSDFETQIKYYQVSYFLLFVEICPSAYLSEI